MRCPELAPGDIEAIVFGHWWQAVGVATTRLGVSDARVREALGPHGSELSERTTP